MKRLVNENVGFISDILLLNFSVVTSHLGAGKNRSIFHRVVHEWKGMGIERFCYPPKPPICSWFAAFILLICISLGKFLLSDSIFHNNFGQIKGDKRVKNNTVTIHMCNKTMNEVIFEVQVSVYSKSK